MGISYAEVLIALVLTLLAGLLLLGASGDAQTIHTYVKEGMWLQHNVRATLQCTLVL